MEHRLRPTLIATAIRNKPPPKQTRTATLFPDTTLFRSNKWNGPKWLEKAWLHWLTLKIKRVSAFSCEVINLEIQSTKLKQIKNFKTSSNCCFNIKTINLSALGVRSMTKKKYFSFCDNYVSVCFSEHIADIASTWKRNSTYFYIFAYSHPYDVNKVIQISLMWNSPF